MERVMILEGLDGFGETKPVFQMGSVGVTKAGLIVLGLAAAALWYWSRP